MSFPKVLSALLLAAALAACGHHASDNSNAAAGIATGTPAPPVNDATPVEGASAGNGGTMAGEAAGDHAMTGGAAAPIPASLNCGSEQPVWVNQRSHVYHEPTDPLYGRTKHGAYMCPDAATAAGYRKAGAHKPHQHS